MKTLKELLSDVIEKDLLESKDYKKGQVIVSGDKKGKITNYDGEQSIVTVLWNDKKEEKIPSKKLKKNDNDEYEMM